MTKIAVCSMFRNSVEWYGVRINHINRYFNQMRDQTIGFENLDFYLLEGDSTDSTKEELSKKEKQFSNIKFLATDFNFQLPMNSMKAHETRIKSLSIMGDFILNNIREAYDYVFWIESDLIIQNNTIENLVLRIESINYPRLIISPFVKIGNLFYDTWAFRSLYTNINWDNNRKPLKKLSEMESVGSCALMNYEIIKDGARFQDGAFINLCRMALEQKAKIYCDESLIIEHPANMINKRWV